MKTPISFGRGIPQAAKIDVFDDFRPYKLRALKAINNGVFTIDKHFIPLMVCTNLPFLLANMNVHNNKYPATKDLSLINTLINTNGGFNFSLLSFDISEFILSPGFYVKNITTSLTPSLIPNFQYSKEIFNPFAPPVNIGRGYEPPIPVVTSVDDTLIDTGAILIYLEV